MVEIAFRRSRLELAAQPFWRLENHAARKSCPDLDLLDDTIANGIQLGKQPQDFRAKREVAQALFCPLTLLGIEFQIDEHVGLLRKHRFAVAHYQPENLAETHPLTFPDEVLAQGG
jgi:hypothetical protein